MSVPIFKLTFPVVVQKCLSKNPFVVFESGGASENVRRLPKSAEFITWGLWMTIKNFNFNLSNCGWHTIYQPGQSHGPRNWKTEIAIHWAIVLSMTSLLWSATCQRMSFYIFLLSPFSSFSSLVLPVSPFSACWLLRPTLNHAFLCMTVLFLPKDCKWVCQYVMHCNLQPSFIFKKKLWWLMAQRFWTKKKKLMTAVMNLQRKSVLLSKALVRKEWFSQTVVILATSPLPSIHCRTEKIRLWGDFT